MSGNYGSEYTSSKLTAHGFKFYNSIPSYPSEEAEIAFEHVDRALNAAGFGDDAWEYVDKV
ncbi:YjgF/Yer057p/UK114 family [Penicillium robsamsonii]|uniref:YjgF/Yer057p/UK114 family n=1 Tax=Penicillium robsamsonii TaxID=1792511 RepID=UPI002546F5FC|nr:YjgF/Yer057p/UK114 family [Penicillium robsamsonii]KAJ5807629.1 YjgF/Yer057p/UK114 family [Penicillium robsamsonii]